MTDDDLHRIADTGDLDEGERLIVTVKGREICVFNLDGEYYGLLNYCLHQGGPLCEGERTGQLTEEDGELVYRRNGEFLSCPWHGWKFDVKSGKDLARPEDYCLPTFDVVERDDGLYVRS